MLTIGQFMVEFKTCRMQCVAGFYGMNRTLSSFSVIDTPEILSWLRGGEFVVDAGYVTKNNPAMLHHLIYELSRRGCAALGIKLHRYFDSVPQELIEQGNQYNFPVITLPYETRFCDLAYAIHQYLFQSQMDSVQKTNTLYCKMVDAICSHNTPDQMLYDLSTVIPNPILLVNQQFELIGFEEQKCRGKSALTDYFTLESGKPILDAELIRAVYQAYRAEHFRTHQFQVPGAEHAIDCIFAPIEMERSEEGFLVIPETSAALETWHYRILENVESLTGLAIRNYEMKNVSEEGDFVTQVLCNQAATDETIRKQCKRNNFDYVSKRVCLNIYLESYLQMSMSGKQTSLDLLLTIAEKLPDSFELQPRLLQYKNYQIIYCFFSDSVSKQHALQQAKQAANHILDVLTQYHIACRIGVSLCGSELTQIPAAFQQTIDSIDLGKRLFPEQKIYLYSDLQIYHWMSETMTNLDLQQLFHETVEPLRTADRKGGNYINTLEAYIRNRYNVTKTAAEIHVHRNTLIYQMEKIQETLELDIDDQVNMMKIQMGLQAMRLLGK